MADAFIPIKPVLVAALETGLNRYLALDEHIEQLLRPLAGKVIAVHITPYAATLYFCPTTDRIQILEDYCGEADAGLKGSLAALGLMGLSATPMRALFKGEVQLSGNVELARKLQNLFAKLDIDLESKVARYAGQRFAQGLGKLFRGSRNWSRDSLNTLRLNLEEFLQEETHDLPAKPEAELLFQQIDECRCDYDRLNARIERLTATLSTERQTPPGTPT